MPVRVVRGGHRLFHRQHRMGAQPGAARGVEELVVRSGGQNALLHWQGQHPLSRRHLAGGADGGGATLRGRSIEETELAL